MPINVPPVQYLRDAQNIIDVSITGLKLDDGRVAFGFAYRSDRDAPDKAVGSRLAIRRAVGMVHAAQNGVMATLFRIDPTPSRGDVLKSFLGTEDVLIYRLGHMNNPYWQSLPARVEKILAGMNKKEKKEG